MPPKRKVIEVDSRETAVPPSLPPSVEEAYRRKCIQLKSRTNEVEEANDAARLRLARIKRQVEKLRIERAFLLEQLAKRTSANVEDSDGSPSPPPTEPTHAGLASEVDANLSKPKEKPLRIKRGHRKLDPDSKGDPDVSFSKDPVSPGGSDADGLQEGVGAGADEVDDDAEGANGLSKLSKSKSKSKSKSPNGAAPSDAFELYCDKLRPELEEKHKDSDVNIEEELEKGWKELSEAEKEEYNPQAKAAKGKASASEERISPSTSKKAEGKPKAETSHGTVDEDVEMAEPEEPERRADNDDKEEKGADKGSPEDAKDATKDSD